MFKALVAASCLLLAAASAHAVELSYVWKKGDVHRFRYEDDTRFKMSLQMPGMAMPATEQHLSVRSTFTQKVLAVRPDGSAEVELTVEKMEVLQDGRKIASEAQLPAAARTVKAEIDRKGRAKFYRMVTVYMKDDQVYLGVEANATGGRASASAGGQTVELVAAIDPKTGAVTASASVKQEAPKLKAVEVKEEDPAVDVLPKDILAMMELPEGDMSPGSAVSIESLAGAVSIGLSAVDKGVARITAKMDGNELTTSEKGISAKKKDGSNASAAPKVNGMPVMPGLDGMMDGLMGGMPGGDDEGAAGGMMGGGGMPGGAPSTGVQQDFDVSATFDVAKGRMLGLEGSASQDVSMGGMGGMKVSSTFKLARQ